MTQHILTGIGDLIEKLVRHSDSITEHGQVMKQAADKLEKLFDYIVDSENNSAIRIRGLEQQIEKLERPEYTWCDQYD